MKWDSGASIKIRSLEIQNRIPSSLLTLTFSGVAGAKFYGGLFRDAKRAAEALWGSILASLVGGTSY